MNRKEHWEKVYNTRQFTEVSWFRPTPKASLDFIKDLQIAGDAAIIDVGGGDSYLVDHLLEQGYSNITVLDISETAINRAKIRLGEKARLVNWVVSDITNYIPDRKFDCWHDRAAFHFLTTEEQVNKYLAVVSNAITDSGKIIVGTFSENGPAKCSGLPVQQYSENILSSLFKKWFQKIKCIYTDHITPFNTIQNFIFCSFKK